MDIHIEIKHQKLTGDEAEPVIPPVNSGIKAIEERNPIT